MALTKMRDGELVEMTPEEEAAFLAEAAENRRSRQVSQVNEERDRRLDDGFTFNGTRFQTRARDRENIAGGAQMAMMAVQAGAQPGDLRWHGGDTDFSWIADDNSSVPMDARTMIAFAQAAGRRHAAIIIAARGIKDRVAAGEDLDITDDALWPA